MSRRLGNSSKALAGFACLLVTLTAASLWCRTLNQDTLELAAAGEPRSGGRTSGQTRIRMHGVEWYPAPPAGVRVSAQADEVRYRRPRYGPFAVGLGLEPEIQGVRIRFQDEQGRECTIDAERARRSGAKWILEGKVRARGPAAELRTSRLIWVEGEQRLALPEPLSIRVDGGQPVPRNKWTTNLWLEPL